MNSISGEILIGTGVALKKTKIKASVIIGTQIISTPEVTFQIFDCRNEIEFTSDLSIQVDSPKKVFPAIFKNSNEKLCKDIVYSIKGLKLGIVMDENGIITVETGKAIARRSL